MDKIRVPRLGPGRPRRRPDSVGADKAYSNRRTRTHLRERGIRHVIPEKRDQAAGRLRRGSRGGRPPGLDKDRYKKHNTVERAINKLKQFRAVATRYDKRIRLPRHRHRRSTPDVATLVTGGISDCRPHPPMWSKSHVVRPKRVAAGQMISLGAFS